jgi:uncharacterized protein YcbK (DUF882 family)
MNNIKISNNFNLQEFQCKDGSCMVKVDERLLEKLQQLRDRFNKPIQIVSAYRTPDYNKKVGGAAKSQHMEGKAADIKINGVTPMQVALEAVKLGFHGIGVYTHDGNYFTHVDVRDYQSYWIDLPGHNLKSVNNFM